MSTEVDRLLVEGKYSLEDALMMTLISGVKPSPWLVALVEAAFNDHREGRKALEDSFGTPRCGNEAQAVEKKIRLGQVFDLVTELHTRYPEGHPMHLALTRSAARTATTASTAFSKAAALLRVHETTLVNKYYKAKKLLDLDKG